MASLVDLGPRAENDALAREIRRRIIRNQQLGRARHAFRRMWGTVVIVRRTVIAGDSAGDIALATAPRELTLRFDFGHLVIHGGRVGRPDVTLWGTDEEILSLGESTSPWAGRVGESALAGLGRRAIALRIAVLGHREAPRADRPLVARAGLSIFGRLSHPRFVYRLVQVLDTSA